MSWMFFLQIFFTKKISLSWLNFTKIFKSRSNCYIFLRNLFNSCSNHSYKSNNMILHNIFLFLITLLSRYIISRKCCFTTIPKFFRFIYNFPSNKVCALFQSFYHFYKRILNVFFRFFRIVNYFVNFWVFVNTMIPQA